MNPLLPFVEAPQAEPLFNPMSPNIIADPYPHYHRLRTIDPVHRSPLGFFVATRHADVTCATSASARILWAA